MEQKNFEKLYKIEEDKLLRYYERLRNQFKNLGPSQIVARFLINQSIGSSYNDVYETLLYFRDKIAEGKELLNLAFEWIRAQKIRLEYKKYLIRAQYPYNNLSLAVDDCIFRFFIEYDKYIRKLLKDDIREYNFSALYEIFFSPYESKNLNIKDILERHIHNVPTHFQGMEKINTNIIILRSGLSVIIVKDYENVLFSRNEERERKELKFKKSSVVQVKIEENFSGLLLDRLIKTYCVRKIEISHKEIENAVSQFLSSYFKFGKIYNFDDFKELLVQNFAEDLISALSERLRRRNPLESVKRTLFNIMSSFRRVNKFGRLDGLAWKNDLTPILKNFMTKFINGLAI
ncbi:MAG: hypothetical protein KAX18_10620 [Candidatus Lokiarchaeota archaeon]|nr:hypothetical protein [Candidatus Lokiarchaeota archaeon]